uniref:Uncharacterized protein n=1 Tax=uncultured Rhodobacterales bacterium HF4000_03E16 TaxID=710785 RepID=E0XV86_9RHOB|nr:hypothetical protein [uncultured Rhodobacterales bacterium HF4000_03E16]
MAFFGKPLTSFREIQISTLFGHPSMGLTSVWFCFGRRHILECFLTPACVSRIEKNSVVQVKYTN